MTVCNHRDAYGSTVIDTICIACDARVSRRTNWLGWAAIATTSFCGGLLVVFGAYDWPVSREMAVLAGLLLILNAISRAVGE